MVDGFTACFIFCGAFYCFAFSFWLVRSADLNSWLFAGVGWIVRIGHECFVTCCML